MSWSKKTNKYSVSSDNSGTTFNLEGTVVKQKSMSQSEANQFLMLNGYDPFKEDVEKSQSKFSEKINGRTSGDDKLKI